MEGVVLFYSSLAFLSPVTLRSLISAVDRASFRPLSYSVAYSTTVPKIDNDFRVVPVVFTHQTILEISLRDRILPVLLLGVIDLEQA